MRSWETSLPRGAFVASPDVIRMTSTRNRRKTVRPGEPSEVRGNVLRYGPVPYRWLSRGGLAAPGCTGHALRTCAVEPTQLGAPRRSVNFVIVKGSYGLARVAGQDLPP